MRSFFESLVLHLHQTALGFGAELFGKWDERTGMPDAGRGFSRRAGLYSAGWLTKMGLSERVR